MRENPNFFLKDTGEGTTSSGLTQPLEGDLWEGLSTFLSLLAPKEVSLESHNFSLENSIPVCCLEANKESSPGNNRDFYTPRPEEQDP